MRALTPIILHTMLDGKKTAVSTLTQGEQVIFPDGSTLPQALARLLAAAMESAAARIVPDIPARDTLPDKYTGLQVWVRDASASAGGDPTVGTVTTGAAGSANSATVAFSAANARTATIAANASYTGRLQIFLDGIRCAAGTNAAQHQYKEVGTAGAASTVIQ